MGGVGGGWGRRGEDRCEGDWVGSGEVEGPEFCQGVQEVRGRGAIGGVAAEGVVLGVPGCVVGEHVVEGGRERMEGSEGLFAQ